MRLKIAFGVLLGLLGSGLATTQQSVVAEFSAADLDRALRAPIDPADPQNAAISGVVVDGITKEPVAGALVALSAPGSAIGVPSRQLTDGRGRFVFVKLAAAANYIVTAERLGYVPGHYTGHARAGATTRPIALRRAEWLSDLRIMLWRPGAITGVVTDEGGEPFAGAFVRALPIVHIQGREELTAGPWTTTDDRGVYRLAGLAPGRYLIQVPSVQSTVTVSRGAAPVPAAGGPSVEVVPGMRLVLNQYLAPPAGSADRRMSYPMMFHPTARTVAEAQAVSLGVSEEHVADIRVQAVEAFRVSGRVEGQADRRASLTVRLLPAGLETMGYGSEVATALVATDGQFTFANVPSGTYTVEPSSVVAELRFATGVGVTPLPMLPGTPVCQGMTLDRATLASEAWAQCTAAAGSTERIELAPPGIGVRTTALGSAPLNYWGRTSVTVDGRDTTDVRIVIQTTGVMRGTAVFETVRGRPTPGGASSGILSLEPAAPGLGLAKLPARTPGPKDTHTFTVEGLLAGTYWLRKPTFPPGWVVKSIIWNGRDYTDVPFDASQTPEISGVTVTLTNGAPLLTGVVRDRSGNTVAGAVVIVFPADRTLWSTYSLRPARVRFATTTSAGAYRIFTLPAGDYYLIAHDGADPNSHHAPGFFERHESLATRRSLSWGQTHTFDLPLSEIRP